MEKTCPHLTQDARMIIAKPTCMLSPSRVHSTALDTVCSQHTDGIPKLVHVDNSAATDWNANCLC